MGGGGGGGGLGWGGGRAGEPQHLAHGGGDAPGEGKNLPLEVDEEGVGLPAAYHLDGAVGHACLVERHGAAGAEGVGADLVGVEA